MGKLRLTAVSVLLAFGVSACSLSSDNSQESSGEESNSPGVMSSLRNSFSLNKSQNLDAGETADTWCPPVDVMKDGANLKVGNAQLTLRHFARECVLLPNKTVRVKVGVVGFALLSQSGRPGSLRAPVHILIKDGDSILGQRVSSPSVVIPPGTARGEFILVEENFIVPEGSINSFDIEIGLSSGGRKRR